jgi:hypothetical protein
VAISQNLFHRNLIVSFIGGNWNSYAEVGGNKTAIGQVLFDIAKT